MKKVIKLFFLLTSFLYISTSSEVHADEPFIPNNTTCKKINTEHVNVLPYNGKNPGITRACVGWTPNFPSTRVEGGQGTYFYFAYKLFPVPMPAYTVTTQDDLGLKQSFSLSEPTTKLGACSPKQAMDSCELYEPFLYYPAKWENRFGSDSSLSDLKGPYTVGPHEFYHYRYRGRLVPQQVTFHFDVIDMEGNQSNIPLAFGDIVYDVPDSCYQTNVIDIQDECRTIQFYVPTESTSSRTLPNDAALGAIPEKRIRFYNPGEHTFRVEVDEKQMYLYQSDEGAEWQGKDGIYREGPGVTEPDEKYIEIHKYAEGAFLQDKYDPATSIGVGNWCYMLDCSIEKADVGMTETVYYNKNGYEGVLKEITVKKEHVLTEGNPSDFQYYHKPYNAMKAVGDNCYTDAFKGGPQTTHCDADGPGYDYLQRGLFKKANGAVYRSEWRQHSRKNGLFLGWNGLKTTDDEFYGYEWKRYQIVGGMVKKKGTTPDANDKYKQYAKGPVRTHTLKTLPHGEIQWLIQDEYKNHCYSEEDGFSEFGEWNKTNNSFTEKDSPVIQCFHNHGDDFHYWKFDWSSVKKFGGAMKKGILF